MRDKILVTRIRRRSSLTKMNATDLKSIIEDYLGCRRTYSIFRWDFTISKHLEPSNSLQSWILWYGKEANCLNEWWNNFIWSSLTNEEAPRNKIKHPTWKALRRVQPQNTHFSFPVNPLLIAVHGDQSSKRSKKINETPKKPMSAKKQGVTWFTLSFLAVLAVWIVRCLCCASNVSHTFANIIEHKAVRIVLPSIITPDSSHSALLLMSPIRF